jgi:hypothetical protein
MSAALSDSLSSYVTPDYDVDSFPLYRNGKRSTSYIYASVYNKIASSMLATQKRCKDLIPLLSFVGQVETRIYLPSSGSIPYTRLDVDNTTPLEWTEDGGIDGGQNGISDAIIVSGSAAMAGSGQIAAEYFYGKKRIESAAVRRLAYRWYERRQDVSAREGPLLLGNHYNGTAYLSAHPNYLGNPDPETGQDLNLSTAGRPLRVLDAALAPTPYWVIGNWMTHEAATKGIPQRVIIGSSRGTKLGTQFRLNYEVFRAPAGVTGSLTVPNGHSASGRTLLGPGALMMNATFFIPPDDATPRSYRRRRFCAVPGMNAPLRHAAPSQGDFYAHVLVLGGRKT